MTVRFLLPFALSVIASAQPRPIQLQDYYLLESVSSPALSPDGRHVAFVRTRIVEAENRRHSEIWLAPSDASAEPVPITDPGVSATNPRWTPDVKLLAYSVARPAGTWFLKMDDPHRPAVQIHGLQGPPVFRSDHRRIAVTKKTPPSAKRTEPATSEFDRVTQ